ncbi:signal recognition particle-docking protein FtsY, partial [Pantoea allii]
MAKEKKRGFFSWLGFGKEEEKQPSTEEQTSQTAQSEVQQPEQEAPAISQAETHAEETVATPEHVVEPQRPLAPGATVEPTPPASDAERALTQQEGGIAPAKTTEPASVPTEDDAPLSDDELAALALADADIVEVAPHEPETVASEPAPVADDAPLSDDELTALA